MEKQKTGYKDVLGHQIHEGDALTIKGQYTGEVFKQRDRWLVAVETMRFMFPMTILPIDIAVEVYKAKVKGEANNNGRKRNK